MKMLNKRAVKLYCKTKGKRISDPAVEMLSREVARHLDSACSVFNGHRVTIDLTVMTAALRIPS